MTELRVIFLSVLQVITNVDEYGIIYEISGLNDIGTDKMTLQTFQFKTIEFVDFECSSLSYFQYY